MDNVKMKTAAGEEVSVNLAENAGAGKGKSFLPDLAELKRIYPVADVSQLVAQEGDAEVILASNQVKVQFGTKSPSE